MIVLFFTEVYPIAKVRIWFGFGGQLLVVLQVFMISQIFVFITVELNSRRAFMNQELLDCYNQWLSIEWISIFVVAVSNIVFILIRSCLRHKVMLDKLPAQN